MKKRLVVLGVVLATISAWAALGPKLVLVTGEGVETSVFRKDAKIFSNRTYRAPKPPDALDGLSLVVAPIDGFQFDCLTAGRLYALAPAVHYEKDTDVGSSLLKQGFQLVADIPVFQLFGKNPWERVNTYCKDVRAGEHFEVAKWAVLLGAGEVSRSEAPVPPYLSNPPATVNVDGGRQLFVDDYLIESANGVVRHWNRPTKLESPIIRPTADDGTRIGGCAVATDGGLWWDPTIGKFRLWYEDNWAGNMRYAESTDGLAWEFPDLGQVKGANRVFADAVEKCNTDLDSWSVWPNYKAANPYADWRIFVSKPGAQTKDMLSASSDGRHFRVLGQVGWSNDRSTLHFDSMLNQWVFSLRAGRHCGRARDFLAVDELKVGEALYWVDSPWIKDAKKPEGAVDPEHWTNLDGEGDHQLYNFDAVAYESVMLGLFEIHQGPENNVCEKAGRPKITEVKFGFSRDGRNFVRGDYTAAIPSEGWDSGKWDAGYVQPLANGCVIKGDELWFYYGAFSGEPTRGNTKEKRYAWTVDNGMYAHAAMGLAKLRRDGFASFDGTGELLTKPLAASGHHLFVNAAAKSGSLAVELVGVDGKVLPGYAAEDSKIENFDSTKCRVVWKTKPEIDLPASVHYRLRFRLKDAALYSFWLSRAPTGESNGWLAGGGPGYAGLRDVPPPRPEVAPHLLAPDAAHALSTRRHEGIPSIAVSPKGRMWATWYAGPTPYEDEGNYLVLTSSTDGGKTWTRPVRVPTSAPHGGIQLKDGRILVVGVQSAATRGEFPEKEPHRAGKLDARHVIAESTDGGRSWRERLMYPDGAWKSCGACEPHLIEARDGTLRCLFRLQEGAAHLLQAESHDGGRTWSVPKETTVDGYPPHLLRLADGRILLTYARRKKDDYGEFAAVSSDDGCTWQACGEIKLAPGGEQDLGYPSSCQLEDGSILTVYYQRAKPDAPHSLMGTKWRIR